MRRSRLAGVGVVVLAALGACSAPDVGREPLPALANRQLDVLFVIDNSGSMGAKQALLASSFPAMLNVLSQVEDGLPDLHLGVVSSNVGAAGQASVPGCAAQGDDGNLLVKAGCTGLTGQFISDVSDGLGSRVKNYTGSLDALFGCMAQLGIGGCGYEMHLESAFRALQVGKNPGFYRAGAYLAVIILADEDDCSTEMGAMFGDPTAGLDSPLGPRTSFRCFEFGVRCENDPTPRAFGTRTGCRPDPGSQFMYEIDRYVGFLKNLKADPSLVIVAGIVGLDDALHTVVVGPDVNTPANPAVEKSCFVSDPNDPDDGATPPIRIAALLRRFPERHALTTICNASLAGALSDIATLIKAAMEGTAPIQPDAGVDAGVDAGGPDGGPGVDDDDGGGCCETGRRAPVGAGFLAALVGLALAPRRRRG